MFRSLAFQAKQKQDIWDHKKRRNRNLKQVIEQKELDISRKLKLLRKRKFQLNDLEKKKQFMKETLNCLVSPKIYPLGPHMRTLLLKTYGDLILLIAFSEQMELQDIKRRK